MSYKAIGTLAVSTFMMASTCGVARASIESATWKDDGDGAVQCQNICWTAESAGGDAALGMTGVQHWGAGHMQGTIQTATGDPTVKLDSSVENDTGNAWIGYQVNAYMDHAFTLLVKDFS